MTTSSPPPAIPSTPALVAGYREAALAPPDGPAEVMPLEEALGRLGSLQPPLVCHARATARRLGTAPFPALDLLELFAFVLPARFCLPTPRGLAAVLGLPLAATLDEEATGLHHIGRALLERLSGGEADRDARRIAWAMGRAGWHWAPAVLGALGVAGDMPSGEAATGLRPWLRLREWEERGPSPPPDSLPVERVEARARLVQLLDADAEDRPQQRTYAEAAAGAFAPRERDGEPRVVIAEAGTGVGKTLGYLAPAHVWARKNKGTVWISTYTRNLQRQLDGELDRVFPKRDDKIRRVVVRKGRENYLCLLNLEEAVNRLATLAPADGVALGLIARWALASRDGDMVGGDFPGWLVDLLGRAATTDLTDSRGECIYAACTHYRKCFIERSVRRARRAEIVVANHALVLIQAAIGGDEAGLPTRYVFDEGHHLFEAADNAFSAHLTGQETAELRRWLLGAEGRRRSRSRGLKDRIGDLAGASDDLAAALDGVLAACRLLPGPGWQQRLAGGMPVGATESVLTLIRQQVYARASDARSGYDLECEPGPTVSGLLEAAALLDEALGALAKPLAGLTAALAKLLDDEAESLDTATRNRTESTLRALDRRGVQPIAAWRAMLRAIDEGTPEDFVDWFGVVRQDGRDVDVGYHRHWIDPMRPLVETIGLSAHGLLITSASLNDGSGAEEDGGDDWRFGDVRTGVGHLPTPPVKVAVRSPFDYTAQTRLFVVGDVGRNDADRVAAAYRVLFEAAGGGALGLFTAIARLRAVHQRIAGPLDQAGYSLLAQHISPLDTGTLIDIFRAEENACLLGTDAVRDGVDVPGRSLRLIVFDRVPWPRPDIRHKARRQAFGGRDYDEALVRLRLKQAYGRLVRRAEDRGVFVMLDRSLPSRLTRAFPEGVAIERVGLAEAAAAIRAFLAQDRGG